MASIGILYGSMSFNTRKAALLIKNMLNNGSNVHDIADCTAEDLLEYQTLIVGTSTWGFGDPQPDLEEFLPQLQKLDLQGKKVALFGVGDQRAYPDSFVNGLRPLYEALLACGAEVIGRWSAEGYDFIHSTALEDGRFIGLVLDEDNQSSMTVERVRAWVEQLRVELGL
ncbi:MAG: flavodoxin [Candidatus Alcyoniella australis]|nr:flavodoxin [Candidatus Alcyoniella australis]